MARPVRYPEHIEPLVQFVEETDPRAHRGPHPRQAGGRHADQGHAAGLGAGGGALVGSAARPSRRSAPSAGGPARRAPHRDPAARRVRADADHPERRGGQQAHPLAGHGPLHPGRTPSRCRSATTSTPRWRRSAPRLAAASSTRAITTCSTCSSGCRRCGCSSICSRSPSPRTSSTITTSCSRSSPGGRSSTSAGSTRSSSAGRRCATSRARRCPRRWTTSTR